MESLRGYFPNASPSVSLLEVRHFRVSVVGAVENPGLTTVTASTRASEAIQSAALLPEAGKRSIRLLRGKDTLRVDLLSFLKVGNLAFNPYVIEGDVLQVPVVDMRWGVVDISGAVVAPGRFELVPGDRVADLIGLAHGLIDNADTTRLELWRFHEGERQARSIEWPQGTTFTDWCQTSLQPEDHILLRDVEGFHSRSSVFLSGELKRPGVYVFPDETVSLRKIVDSAGGFTEEADLAHAYVIRRAQPAWQTERAERVDKIPVEILSRLESDWIQAEALSMPGRVSTDFVALFEKAQLQYDLMLADGDQVIVPKQTNYVNVIGQVVQPGLVAHDPGGSLAYYLERVGGYAWRADRGRTFVLKGGTGAAVKKGSVGSLDPGDIIVVPTKRERDVWSTLKESMVVVANLATIYLVIDQATR
jgi:protein involved in polysaccharide export with SLBB domain